MKTNYLISLRKFSSVALFVALFCVLTLPPRSSQAGLGSLVFQTGTGTSLPASGTVVWSGHPRRAGLASAAINFGFTFNFDGAAYTQFIVYSSGYVSLGSTQQSNNTNPNIGSTSVPVISGFWGSNVMLSGGSNPSWYPTRCGGTIPTVQYEMTGTAPNRVMTVEWNHIDVNHREDLNTWQIRMYESGTIELFYTHMTPVSACGSWGGSSSATSCAIGVGNGSSDFVSITPQGGNSATTSTSSANNTIDLQSNPIADNTLYKFVSPNVQLKVVPHLLSFGNVLAGTSSSPLCFTVQDVGPDPVTLNINSVTITGSPDFKVVSSPASNSYQSEGPSGTYCVQFTPSGPGLRTATLTVTSNGRDSGVQSITLTGIGLVAEYTIDSLIRFKKTRTRLGDSLTQYVHITSIGGAPFFISSFNFGGGDPGQYFISHFPVNPLPPGQSDSIGITYVPTLEGRHTATLTLISNSFLHPSQTIQLLGTGILPHIVVTPSLLLFDSTREGDTICKNITIFNPGSDTLKLSSNFLTSNDGDFHYTGLSGSDTAIAPEQSKTVGVCFIPIQQGERQARLFLKTNIIKTFETPRRDTAGIVTVNISGTGVPFGLFAFTVSGSPFTDSALVGVQVCRQDTLKNNGDADILVNGFAISGTNGSDFSSSGLPSFPFLLKARSFKTFTICGTPDKQGLLTGTGTVSGTTSGSNVSLGLPLGIFGFVPCIAAKPASLFINPQVTLPNNGSDSVLCDTITNCGDIAAVYTATISGTSKGDYSVTPTQSAVVPANGGKTIFCVTYKPSVVGVSPATLNVAATDGSTSVKVPLSGADGCAVLTATTPEVPNTGVGAKGTFTVTINNTGTFPLILGNGSIAPADGHFKFIGAVPDTIPPGGSSTVTLEFDPSEVGTVSAALSFPTSGPCLSDTLNVTLNGQGIVNSVNETASEGFSLDQSYPNPTQGNTWFTYTTPRETEISLKLVDMTGKLVRTLITGRVSEGPHTVNFDASNLPSGTYIYMLESGNIKLARELILTR